MKRMAYLTLFTSLFITFLGARFAFARTYTGYVERSNNTFYVIKNELKLEMKFADVGIRKSLQNLSDRDYISVDANLLPAQENSKKSIKVILVSSVNYVGLNEMIGFWKDKNGLCYYFIGFTNIRVFIPGPQLKCHPRSIPEINQSSLTSYNYFINPDDDVWMMLISNETSQYLAELSSISSTKKKLVMYNAEDGKELSTVILYKAN